MYFKKFGKTIFGVQLNKAEQKAMDQEIRRQIVENDRRYAGGWDGMIPPLNCSMKCSELPGT